MNDPKASEDLIPSDLDDRMDSLHERISHLKENLRTRLEAAKHEVEHPAPFLNIPNEPFSLADLITPPHVGLIAPEPEPSVSAMTEDITASTETISAVSETNSIEPPKSDISHVTDASWTPPSRGVMAEYLKRKTRPEIHASQPKPAAEKPKSETHQLLKSLFFKPAKSTVASAEKPADKPAPTETTSSALPKQVKTLTDAENRFKERQKRLQDLVDKQRGKLT